MVSGGFALDVSSMTSAPRARAQSPCELQFLLYTVQSQQGLALVSTTALSAQMTSVYRAQRGQPDLSVLGVEGNAGEGWAPAQLLLLRPDSHKATEARRAGKRP